MRKPIHYIILLIILFAVACANDQYATQSSRTVTETILPGIPALSITPNIIIKSPTLPTNMTPTPAPTLETTPSITSTSTNSITTNIDDICSDWKISENALLLTVDAFAFLQENNQLYLKYLDSRPIEEVETNTNYNDRYFSVSPNHELIAFQRNEINSDGVILKSEVIFVDSAGEKKITQSLSVNEELAGWINDDHVAIRIEDETGSAPEKYLIINPFTQKDIPIDPALLPNFDLLASDQYLWSTLVIFDPSLKFVAYPSIPDPNSTSDLSGRNLSVIDYIENKPLGLFLNFDSSPYSKPKWTPDGEKIAFLSSTHKYHNQQNFEFEIYAMDLKGQVHRLTNLTDEYHDVYIGEFSWSPDGNRIAFWVITSEDLKNSYLAVLDISSGIITKTCVKGMPTAKPNWTGNGTAIIVQEVTEKNKPGGIVYINPMGGDYLLSDIITNDYYLGWLSK
jgi:hypothetical protein